MTRSEAERAVRQVIRQKIAAEIPIPKNCFKDSVEALLSLQSDIDDAWEGTETIVSVQG